MNVLQIAAVEHMWWSLTTQGDQFKNCTQLLAKRMDVTFVRLIFAFASNSQMEAGGYSKNAPREEKCKIYPKLIWPELSVWGPTLRHLVHNWIRQVLLRKFKRNISFSLFNRTFGQTVSSTKQFVLNSRISFLGLNLYFFCKNIWFWVVSFVTNFCCRH